MKILPIISVCSRRYQFRCRLQYRTVFNSISLRRWVITSHNCLPIYVTLLFSNKTMHLHPSKNSHLSLRILRTQIPAWQNAAIDLLRNPIMTSLYVIGLVFSGFLIGFHSLIETVYIIENLKPPKLTHIGAILKDSLRIGQCTIWSLWAHWFV